SNISESLYVKKYELFDNVIPSSNAVIAHVLYRLGLLYDVCDYTSIAEKMLHQFKSQISQSGPYAGKWASLLGFIVSGSPTLAVVGSESTIFALKLKRKTNTQTLICGGIEENIPYLKDKLMEGKTAIYSCKNNTCSAPIFTVDEVLENKYP
ncbi:MAG: hypothetical protein Q7U08_06590, partial [Flavobacteriaceae bacterium]|nr:hypothetical protein [Flavobacteriaceae bacterium]